MRVYLYASVIQLVLILLVCGTVRPVRAAAAEPAKPRPDIVGWYYAEGGNAPFDMLVKVWREPDGRLRGSSDNLARGEKNHVATSVFYAAPNFRMETDWYADFYKGKLSEDGTKLEVVYCSGDFSFPMICDRIEPGKFPPDPELSYAPTRDGAGVLGGFWNGSLELQGGKVRHVLRLGRVPDGSLRGKLDMIESGERLVPLTLVKVTGRDVRLECKPFHLVYAGRLSEDGKRMEMKLERGTVTATVVFHRADAPWEFEDPRPGIKDPALARALEGDWVGTADRQSTFSQISLRFGQNPEGQARVRYRPAIGEPEGVPMLSTSVRFEGREFTAEWLGALWGFGKSILRGTLDEARQRITGVLEEFGTLSPVVLERPKPPLAHVRSGQ